MGKARSVISGLPEVPPGLDDSMSRFLGALREAIVTREGLRGIDSGRWRHRSVTLGMLVDNGTITENTAITLAGVD